jgi:hypothetical protein
MGMTAKTQGAPFAVLFVVFEKVLDVMGNGTVKDLGGVVKNVP